MTLRRWKSWKSYFPRWRDRGRVELRMMKTDRVGRKTGGRQDIAAFTPVHSKRWAYGRATLYLWKQIRARRSASWDRDQDTRYEIQGWIYENVVSRARPVTSVVLPELRPPSGKTQLSLVQVVVGGQRSPKWCSKTLRMDKLQREDR